MATVEERNISLPIDVDLSKLEKTADILDHIDKVVQGMSGFGNMLKSVNDFAEHMNKLNQTMDDIQQNLTHMDEHTQRTFDSLSQTAEDSASGMREAFSVSTSDIGNYIDKLHEKMDALPDKADFSMNDNQLDDQLRNARQQINDVGSHTPIRLRIDDSDAVHDVDRFDSKFKDETNKLPKEMPLPKPTGQSRWENAFDEINKRTNIFTNAADKASDRASRFKSIVGGAAIAGMVSNGVINSWYSLTNGIKEAAKAGLQYNEDQQRMQATWTTLTGTQHAASRMRSRINQFSMHTGQDTGLVNESEQGFYHLHSNEKESNTMTSALLNMVDAVGLNGQQANTVSQDMVHSISGGTIQRGDLNVIGQYFPMFNEALEKYEAKVHHVSEVSGADLRKMAKSGQISAHAYEAVFEELGNHKYGNAAERMMTTMFGMQRTVKSQMQRLMGDITNPIFKAENPFYKAVSKWVTDPRTGTLFTKFGKSINNVINSLLGIFPALQHTSSATSAFDKVLEGMTSAMNKFAKWIRDNPKQIKAMGRSMGEMVHVGFDTFIESLKILNVLLKPLEKFATKHPKQFADIAASYIIATSAVKGLTTAMGTLMIAGKGVRSALNFGGDIVGALGGKGSMIAKVIGRRDVVDDAGKKIGESSLGDRMLNRGVLKNGASSIGDFGKNLFTNFGHLGASAEEGAGSRIAGMIERGGMIGRVGRLASFGARRIPIAGTVLAGTELLGMNTHNRAHKVGGFVGNVGGGLGGAAAGAAIGSVIPGVGTAIGAGVGGIVGSLGGSALGHKIGNLVEKNFRHSNSPIRKTITGWGRNIGKWTKSALNGIGKFFTGGFKWEKSISKAFSGIVKSVEKIWSPIGRTLEKPLDFIVGVAVRIGQSLRKPFQQAVKAIKEFFSGLGSWFSKLWSGIEKIASHVWQGIGNLAKGAWNVIVKAFSPLVKLVGGAFQIVGKIAGTLWNDIKQLWGGAYHFFAGVFEPVGKFVGGVFHGIANIAQSVWKTISNIFGNIGKEIGKIGDIIKKSPIGKFVGGIGNWIHQTTQLGHRTIHGHAVGGKITKPEIAMVGEKGTELLKRNNLFSLIGVNGPTMMPLRPNDMIYTNKQLNSMLKGHTTINIHGYAGGTGASTQMVNPKKDTFELSSNLDKAFDANSIKRKMEKVHKTYSDSFDKMNKDTTETSKSMDKTWTKFLDNMHDNSTKSNKKLNQDWQNSFQDMYKNSVKYGNSQNKDFSNTLDNNIDNYTKFGKQLDQHTNSIEKEWISDWSDMSTDFKSEMNKLPGYASDSMSSVVGRLNRGIKSINVVLSEFGGHSSTLSMMHYATGTMNGQIAYNHLGVLNDAKVGPRQEAIIRNGQALFPQGNDVVVPLKRGDMIMNGEQVHQGMNNGTLPHYSKGTVSQKLADALTKKIDSTSAHASKAFGKDFDNQVGSDNGLTALGRGMFTIAINPADKQGKNWYNEVWSQLSGAVKGGGTGAGGTWRHTPGLHETNGFGAPRSFGSHDGVDFSGPLGSAILSVHGGKVTRVGNPVWDKAALGDVITVASDDGWQEIYQEFGGMGNIHVHTGQIIKTGQRIATLGALNGAGSGPHVHIGVSHGSLWDHGGSNTHGWYDVTKMHGKDNGSDKLAKQSHKNDSALAKLVGRQIAPQLKWLQKEVAPKEDEGGSIGSFGLSGGITSRARSLAKALKQLVPSATNNGIAAILGNWEFESRLNPSIRNSSGGASGLGQWLGPRLTSLGNYAKRKHMRWDNPALQLEFAVNGDGTNSSILKSILHSHEPVATLANRFSSQWERGGYNAQHVEGARKIQAALRHFAFGGKVTHPTLGLIGENHGQSEWVINPHQDNADGLIDEVSAYRRAVTGQNGQTAVKDTITSNKPVVEMNVTFKITGGGDADQLKDTYKKSIKPQEQKMINQAVEQYFREFNREREKSDR